MLNVNDKGKWVFIVNPVAGSGYGLSQIDKIKEMISRLSLEADIVFTERRGHASELSARYADSGYRYIIAVGGDGTFSEVATPLVSRRDIIAGQIPGGTANGVNELAGFPEKYTEKEWETFFKADAVSMDVGVCNDRSFFFTGIGIGFDVQVAENFNRAREINPGKKQNYLWIVLKTILFYKEKKMVLISDGKTVEAGCFMNTVSNGARTYAKAFLLTPGAIANDGLLDICSIKSMSLPGRIKLLLNVPKGKHLNDRNVHYFRTPELSAEFPVSVPYHADGEISYAQSFKLGVMPDGLNLIFNPHGNHHFSIGQEN
jgi:YegS/Rv2252/BmrU family lipid kinase